MNGNFKIGELVGPGLDKLQRNALIAAVVGLILCVAGILLRMDNNFGAQRFFESYLWAFMFWFGLTMGSLALLMIHQVTGGGWGFILRRPLEAATRNLPIVLGMFVPILVGMGHLYARWIPPYTHNGLPKEQGGLPLMNEHGQSIVALKAQYLNQPGFIIRAVIYFVIWFWLAHILNSRSKKQDVGDDGSNYERTTKFSAGGLLIFVLTITFATIDWVMSLEPLWFSSLFGVIFAVGQGLSTLAIMALLISRLAGKTELVQSIEPRYFRDIGNLTLAFTLLWAYTNFSQYLIYYSGNIAEEVEWFVHRMHGPWIYIIGFLAFFHFFFPFFTLLSSTMKVNINNLAKIGLWILLMRQIDLFWYVTPTFRQDLIKDNWLGAFWITDLGAPLLLGGIWLFCWAKQVRGSQVVPAHDPRLKPYWPLKEVVNHG
jgi:hypothetical protein